MILSQFASRLSGRCPIPEHIFQASRARGWGGKMAQNGDFAVAWSLQLPLKFIRFFSSKDMINKIRTIRLIDFIAAERHAASPHIRFLSCRSCQSCRSCSLFAARFKNLHQRQI